MKNILVTIDFEEKVEVLINKAISLAVAFNAKVWLMHITQPEPDFVGYDVGPQYIRDNRASVIRQEHRLMDSYAGEFKEKGIDCEGLLLEGSTIELIISESKKLNADLIIAGHHKHGFIYNAFNGSVSSEILKKSMIPVLIVPL